MSAQIPRESRTRVDGRARGRVAERVGKSLVGGREGEILVGGLYGRIIWAALVGVGGRRWWAD